METGASYWPGAASALLVGFSKTGVPGAGIPAVALMAEAFREDTKLSVGAMLPILILGDLFAIGYYRRHAQWNRIWELVPYVAVGMLPGYLVLWLVPGDYLRVLLGTLILLLLLLHAGRQRFGWQRVLERPWFTAATGVMAGFGTTVGNAAGPVMSIYLVSRKLDKHEFIGTAAWFFFLVNTSKIPFFLLLGVMNSRTVRFDILVVPTLVIGALLGASALKRLPQLVFDALVLVLAGAAAARLILF